MTLTATLMGMADHELYAVIRTYTKPTREAAYDELERRGFTIEPHYILEMKVPEGRYRGE